MPADKTPRFKWRKEYTELLSYSAVGLEMGLAVGIGIFIGYAIDFWALEGKYSPWITLFFFAMGIAAAFKAFVTAAREMQKKVQKGEDTKRPE